VEDTVQLGVFRSGILIHHLTFMNKRTFLKLLSAVVASPAISSLPAWANEKLTNWAGNLEYSTDRLYSANSLAQVRNYVQSARHAPLL
jgi:hypothetical protein